MSRAPGRRNGLEGPDEFQPLAEWLEEWGARNRDLVRALSGLGVLASVGLLVLERLR